MADTSAVLVDARGHSMAVGLLNMRCDAQQIPEPLDGTKPRLFRGRGTFTGTASPWNEGGSPGQPAQATAEGRTALGIAAGRVYGILTPDLAALPSVWFSLPLRSLRVVEEGRKGVLKGRPEAIQFGNDQWRVRLSDVNLIIPASGGRLQPKQEGTLVELLKV
ncbi:MAG: hypothetical protein WAM97_02070 [Acidimicrobiales bacterium]